MLIQELLALRESRVNVGDEVSYIKPGQEEKTSNVVEILWGGRSDGGTIKLGNGDTINAQDITTNWGDDPMGDWHGRNESVEFSEAFKAKETGWYVVDHMDKPVEGPMQEEAAYSRAEELSGEVTGDVSKFYAAYFSQDDLKRLEEATKPAKRYIITKVRDRDAADRKPMELDGTLEELIDKVSYTLETGYSYQHEKGNKKINKNPRTIADLVKNLNNAVNNAASNGYAGTTYSFKEAPAEVVKEEQLEEKVFDTDRYEWFAWTKSAPITLERRGGAKEIKKGMQFGIRAATSKPGTFRVILKAKGPSIIFSVDGDTVKKLKAGALELLEQ